jgi:hypothetical protein
MEHRNEMVKQPRRNLYLYLALACFLGIVLIFLFDGYLGLYDSLAASNGSYQQEVPVEEWQNPDRYGGPYGMSLDQNGYLDFTYKVANRRFAGYSAEVVVTLTDINGVKSELLRQTLSAGAFQTGELTWTLQGADLLPASTPQNVNPSVTLTIQRGSETRVISLYINRNVSVLKQAPAGAG